MLKRKEKENLQEKKTENPINVLSFKHPDTNQDYFTAECDSMFRSVNNKS